MNPLTKAVVQMGLVDRDIIEEVRRFGAPVEGLDTEEPRPPADQEELLARLQEALTAEESVAVRETDLEVLEQYRATHRNGVLRLSVVLDGYTNQADIPVSYGRTALGDYLIPWQAETISQMLTNGETYLQTYENTRVYFKDVRELFYGNVKAFMVCVPSVTEEAGGGDAA